MRDLYILLPLLRSNNCCPQEASTLAIPKPVHASPFNTLQFFFLSNYHGAGAGADSVDAAFDVAAAAAPEVDEAVLPDLEPDAFCALAGTAVLPPVEGGFSVLGTTLVPGATDGSVIDVSSCFGAVGDRGLFWPSD